MSARCAGWVLLVVVLGLVVPASVGAEVTWPEDGDWVRVTRAGDPLVDEVGDANAELDLIGTVEFPAALRATDATHLFFRLRLDGDPAASYDPLELRPRGWAVELDVDEDPTDYEVLVVVNGSSSPDAVEIWRNLVQAEPNAPDDTAEERIVSRPIDPFVRVVDADSTLGGTRDHFLDLAVERHVLRSMGWRDGYRATPTRWIFGTSTNGHAILTDLAAPGDAFTLVNGASDAAICDGLDCFSCVTGDRCGGSCEACPSAAPYCLDGDQCVTSNGGGNGGGNGGTKGPNRLAGGPINGCATAGGDVALAALVAVGLFLALRRRRGLLLGAVLLLAPWGASAAELEAKAALERLHPTMFGDGIAVNGTDFSAENPLRLELLAHYERAPLVVVDGDGDRLAEAISDRLTFDLVGALGLTDWLALGARLPLVLQDGDAGAFRLVGESGSLETFGVGDPELALHARLLDPQASVVGIALMLGGTLPAAGGGSFIGETGGTLSPAIALSRRLGDRAMLGLDLAFTARENVDGDVAVDAGDELLASLGGVYRLGDGVSLIGELLGGTGSADPFEAEGTSLEVVGGLRGVLGAGFHGLVGGGAGILDGYGVPEYRVLAGVGWRWADMDHAPVEEPVEPLAEEETESEYVPEPARVAEPEPAPAPEPEPVAPEPEPVVEPAPPPPAPAPPPAPRREELKERVLFASGRASLTPEARRQLDELVKRIGAAAAARIALSLEGHADPAGNADANRELSRARVETVRQYLAGKGAPAPVKADWHGEEVTGATHEAPVAEDRRVDVIVVLER